MNLREAAQQALEALSFSCPAPDLISKHNAAESALRAALEQPEPPPEPIHIDRIRAEFRDIDRHTLPGETAAEDWFEAGVRFAERQHEIV